MGRRRSSDQVEPGAVNPFADSYAELVPVLAGLRDRVADRDGDLSRGGGLGDAYGELERWLRFAMANALAADAAGAPVTGGVATWMGEALVRSRERELILLARSDVCGALTLEVGQPSTARTGTALR